MGWPAPRNILPARSREGSEEDIVNASARTLFALFINRWRWSVAELALLVCATASWLLMELMNRWFERTRRRAGTPGRTGGQ